MLRARHIIARLAVSERTFYRFVERGHFPKGRRISDNVTAWPESVVDAWIADRLREDAAE
jgi:predicted DNA-binding transcriptional regulator AlpA